jgi:hypothetical protein
MTYPLLSCASNSEKPGVDVAKNLETLFGELTHHVPGKHNGLVRWCF